MKNRVKELRLEKGILQENLARKIGTTQQTISKIESCKYIPSTDLLINIASYFNVSIDYLLCLSDYRKTAEGVNELYLDIMDYAKLIELYKTLSSKDQELLLQIGYLMKSQYYT